MRGAQNTRLENPFGCVNILIELPSNTHLSCIFYVVSKVTTHLPLQRISQHKEFNQLKLADPNYCEPAQIDALFGIGIWISISKSGFIKSSDELAAAQKTVFGWVIYQTDNETSQIHNSQIKRSLHIHTERTVPDLSQIMQRFWEVENIPDIRKRSPEEEECERLFMKNHTRNRDGRYVVHIPFNDKIKLLGKSKSIAIRQFFSIERKMLKNEQYKLEYHEFMSEFESLGHISKIKEHGEDGCYIPHHGIQSGNKFRQVFNASSNTSTGISLNDCQLVGEKLQRDLSNILINFRSYQFAFTADIVKMFRQVEINDCHKKYQKIIWRYSPDEPICVYQINRVAYGQAAALHLAVRAMQQCASDHQNEYPKGAKAVLESFYVDDILDGADTKSEAFEIIDQLKNLLEKGCFPLAKWCSNKLKLSDKGPEFLDLNEPDTISVLGLRWLPKTDVFTFQTNDLPSKNTWTKRQVLSEIGKLYDPNGYLAPIVITAKILIQSIWQVETDWDENIPNTILYQWTTFLENLPAVNKIFIPRWLGMNKIWITDLHCYSDASESAYSAVVYARSIDTDGKVTIRLIQSKTKVAPLKKLTIPRLELSGAHLLAKLSEVILSQFDKRITNCHFWTDSEVILAWIKKSPNQLKTFVANRVAAIQHKTVEKGYTWRWVAGEDNPADLASRGVTPHDLINNDLWWHGPKWLKTQPEFWPKQKIPNYSDESIQQEVKLVALITVKPLQKGSWFKAMKASQISSLLSSYSNFSKLKRVMAYVLRAIDKFKFRGAESNASPSGSLSGNELDRATLMLIRIDQANTFTKELNEIENDTNKNGTIWLEPTNNVLRLKGRVMTDNLTLDEQNPMILSPKGELAPLIIREAHLKTLHGGVQLVLQTIRQHFWIFQSRRLARSIINKCTKCFRYNAKLSSQLMAPLPSLRTMPNKAFTSCGVDYFGPVGVSSKTGRFPTITKGYGCVFVCFSTRAIHLELVSDASTTQFIQALRRFTSRRGPVTNMLSDNGTNFVGANNYLQQIYDKNQKTNEISKTFEIKWRFITPNAPHHGGLHEAAVKSVKYHLKRVIGAQNLTFEEYATLLCQVEACVNSRPIQAISDDPNDLNALTPAHFLIGQPLIALVEPRDLKEVRTSYLKRWEMVQQMHQHFWDRWHKEYLTNLSQHPKWQKQEANLRENELVLLKEDHLPPSQWSLGRIIETFPGKDNLVRSVKVKTSHGTYNRPITKLGRLPIYNQL